MTRLGQLNVHKNHRELSIQNTNGGGKKIDKLYDARAENVVGAYLISLPRRQVLGLEQVLCYRLIL